jgi:ubiquinone/menaquinone biosynthesis C-methylase UbiE/c-di-GMP-binding flagellar brake protein YcgR/dienelactone hydrolase
MGREKRRHIRVAHQGTVAFATGERTYHGTSLNISRSGMQVVVNMPESYERVRSITFQLPVSKQTMSLPCRLVHVDSRASEERQVLGVEFIYEAEAQLLLIDQFIREMRRAQLSGTDRSGELRQLPRAACAIREIRAECTGIDVLSIDNISTSGLLISFRGTMKPDQTVCLSFRFPGDARAVKVSAQVVYVIDNPFNQVSFAGLRLRELRETDAARIRNYIVDAAPGATLRSMHEWLSCSPPAKEQMIADSVKTTLILRKLAKAGMTLNVLFDQNMEIVSLPVKEVDAIRKIFYTAVPEGQIEGWEPRPRQALCSCYLDGGNYFFKTEARASPPGRITFDLPSAIYQSDKRSYRRKVLDAGAEITLFPKSANAAEIAISGRIIEVSRHGFLCEVPLTESVQAAFHKGQLLSYEPKRNLGLDSHGQIRHLKQVTGDQANPRLRIGIEAGIRRKKFIHIKITEDEWKAGKPDQMEKFNSQSRLVRYGNLKGQQIAALVNSTREQVRAPVVIVPPAFGKKKEALAPFVATLLANFGSRNRELVTLRFDGINRPGESHNEQKEALRGYEMMRYRMQQGIDDLAAALDFAFDNPYFTPSGVVLVTFSMSALDARRLLATKDPHNVDAWISCMGLPAAQSTLANVLAGCDVIGNYRLGIPNGVCGLLGQLMDLDIVAGDLIDNKMSYLTDGRLDMARISIPVLWLSGKYDRWVSPTEVMDLMSVASPSERKMIELPTGHNLRTSADAIETFKLISEYCFQQMYGERIQPVQPDEETLLRMINEERERLVEREDFKARRYWKFYLIGNDGCSSGYDFYRNIDPFMDFMHLEARLADPQSGDRIADLGCGTGLLLECLLEKIANLHHGTPDVEIVALDLVEEALQKARDKCARLRALNSELQDTVIKFQQMDLEPNRLIPIQELLNDGTGGFDYLRQRVKGLRNATIDAFNRTRSPALTSLLQGDRLSEPALRDLESRLKDGHFQAALDLNRAARFLLKRLEPADLVAGMRRNYDGPLSEEAHLQIRTRDIRFEVLDFGDHGLDLQLPLADRYFSKILASLFLSYLPDPESALQEFYRMLKPGGRILVSSMKPDCDLSLIFTDFTRDLQDGAGAAAKADTATLSGARHMLNEVSGLFGLEEDGYFRFFSARELERLLKRNGFAEIEAHPALGTPAQALVVTARKPTLP